MAVFVQSEGREIARRTKEALAEAKKRGKKLVAQPGNSPLTKWLRENGNAKGVQGNIEGAMKRAAPWKGIMEELVAQGLSLRGMARELNRRGERTPKGCEWAPMTVSRLVKRLELVA